MVKTLKVAYILQKQLDESLLNALIQYIWLLWY